MESNIKEKKPKPDYVFRDVNCKYIGGGADAKVYNYDNKFAIKKYEPIPSHKLISSKGVNADYIQEVKFLNMLQECPNIVRIHESGIINNEYFIILELCGTSVTRYIRPFIDSDFILPTELSKKICKDALTGIAYLHSKNIIHRDIKPENLVFANPITILSDLNKNNIDQSSQDIIKNNSIKLIDFCTCIEVNEVKPKLVGTLMLASPEMLTENQIGLQSDIWSYIATVFEITTTQVLFDNDNYHEYDYFEEFDETLSDNDNKNEEDRVDDESIDEFNSESSETDDEENEMESISYLLYLIQKILGPPPSSFAMWAPDFYNTEGRLIVYDKCTYMGLEEFVKVNLTHNKFKKLFTQEFYRFLKLGLQYEPLARASADTLLDHPWLKVKTNSVQNLKKTIKNRKRI